MPFKLTSLSDPHRKIYIRRSTDLDSDNCDIYMRWGVTSSSGESFIGIYTYLTNDKPVLGILQRQST